MQCNTRRNLFTSLVGTVPLNDGKYLMVISTGTKELVSDTVVLYGSL